MRRQGERTDSMLGTVSVTEANSCSQARNDTRCEATYRKHQDPSDVSQPVKPGLVRSSFWDLFHLDLKTAFLQGEHYNLSSRMVVVQLPQGYRSANMDGRIVP